MDPRGIPTFSEGVEKKSLHEEEYTPRLHSPVHSTGFSVSGVSGVHYVEQPRAGTSVRSVHLLKHQSGYSGYTEASVPKRLTRRSASNNSNLSKMSNSSTKTPTSAHPSHDHSRAPAGGHQIPTFTEQTWNTTHSTPSTPGCNSTSTSTEEERHAFDRIPPSFSLHKELEGPDESQPIYHTKTVRHRREKDWRYTTYYSLVFCTAVLLCVLILLMSVYVGLGSEVIPLNVEPSGIAYRLEVPDWLTPGPMVIKFAPLTFGDSSAKVIIQAKGIPQNVSDLFTSTTMVHGKPKHQPKMLWIECDTQPEKFVDLVFPAPTTVDGANEFEAFSMFEVNNGWAARYDVNLQEFEVLERRFQPGNLMDITLPVTAFSSLSNQQGPPKWFAMVLLAELPGVKRNITTEESDRCITILCPLEGNDCEKNLKFVKIDTLGTELPNLGATYWTVPGARVNGVEGTSVFFFQYLKTGFYGVVVTKPSGARILYLGLKTYNEEDFELDKEIPLSEDVPLLGTLPTIEKDNVPLVVEVYPPREYLAARNFPKQRVEPCLTTGDVIRSDFLIQVLDAGIINDDKFDLFWDGTFRNPEQSSSDGSVYKFNEITDTLHVLRLRAKRRAGSPVYDKKATFHIKLTNLKFFDTSGFQDVEVVNPRERRGWFDADSDITFRVEIARELS